MKFYATTPIYYVNDKPHIGHAYTTLLGDVLARYHRLLGHDTLFLTGTDEHGQKVQEAAAARGVSEQAHVDETVQGFQALWKRLEITHDDFIRTTEPRHVKVVQQVLQDLFDRDEIYKAEYDGLYDVRSETFITEKDLPEGKTVENLPHIKRIKETNYFFRMGKYQDWLVNYIHENPGFIQPDFRRNETLGFLRKPLQDLCISRPKARLSWGIELPFDADFVTYVWFDALINYVTAPGYLDDNERFEKWWPADYHLIGKDILTTHSVYWPTMLQAMGLPQPRCIFAHGWWLSGKDKMSKSEGNVVDPMEYADRFGVDAFRYFLIAEMTLGQDAAFTEDVFIQRYNSDLVNDLGNLASRVLKLSAANFGGVLPDPGANEAPAGEEEVALWAGTRQAVKAMTEQLERMRLDLGVAEVMAAVRAVNRYIEHRKPWMQAKEEDKTPLAVTLYTAAEVMRVLAALLYPIMPGKMTELRKMLGLDGGEPSIAKLTQWGVLKPGSALPPPEGIFPRYRKEEAAKPPQGVVDPKDLIKFDDVGKIKLRTAEILEAEKVEGADKLLKLQLDVGGERRQIIAGIAKHYAPEDLPGKCIIIVANLEPAKIRGIESQGMLLAASKGKKMRLLTVDGELASGAKVG